MFYYGTEGLPVVKGNKGTKENYRREQGDINAILNTGNV